MKCHYEILGLSETATSDELKKAYRKLALEWHPDKNLQREDEAKEEFQLIQQAYEILSDPQERAWYDRHREDILFASSTNDYKDDTLDVYQYFNSSCFKGYTDEEKGFYAVYRDVFRKIATEDEPFMDESDIEIPEFGLSDSSYEDVVHNFYAYWQSYCTAKTFVWIEQYNLSENRKAGAGRNILRAIEKENKKLRDQHKKHRNEEVRQLVAFVRKRDKRVQAHKKLLEEQNAEKARKFQEQRRKQMEDRKKDLESYQETEWSSMSQYEDHFNQIEANLDSAFGAEDADDDDSEQACQGLYCAACDKDFRSSKSMQNHEKSKKHKESVLLLKHLMQEDEVENSSQLLDETSAMPDASYYGKDFFDGDSNNEEPDVINDQQNDRPTTRRKKKKKKKAANKPAEPEDLSDKAESDLESKLNSMTICEEPQQNGCVAEPIDEIEVVSNAITETSPKETKVEEKQTTESCVEPENLSDKSGSEVKSKPKETRCKKTKGNRNISPENDKQKQSTVCEKCGYNFHSRNKLFDHLKESGHAVYLTDNTPPKPTRNATKRTKNKKMQK